jgi:hypothetical protein
VVTIRGVVAAMFKIDTRRDLESRHCVGWCAVENSMLFILDIIIMGGLRTYTWEGCRENE